MKSYKSLINYVVIAGMALFIIIALVVQENKSKTLHSNGKYTKAVVTEFYTIRFTDHFRYKFTINGKDFSGSDLSGKNTDSLSIGDTITIIYNSQNPSVNKYIPPILKE